MPSTRGKRYNDRQRQLLYEWRALEETVLLLEWYLVVPIGQLVRMPPDQLVTLIAEICDARTCSPEEERPTCPWAEERRKLNAQWEEWPELGPGEDLPAWAESQADRRQWIKDIKDEPPRPVPLTAAERQQGYRRQRAAKRADARRWAANIRVLECRFGLSVLKIAELAVHDPRHLRGALLALTEVRVTVERLERWQRRQPLRLPSIREVLYGEPPGPLRIIRTLTTWRRQTQTARTPTA